MSRLIQTRQDKSSEKELRSTADGKLILTCFKGKNLVLLIRENRLIHVSVPEEYDSKVGAVYLGKIKNIVKNIDACFVEIENGELVYLPLSLCKYPFLTNRAADGRILEGDELLVQISRDALKTKQASATTQITLTGRYFVLAVGSRHVGISSKLDSTKKEKLVHFLQGHRIVDHKMNLILSNGIAVTGDESFPLEQIVKSVPLPSYGLVVRTEASEASEEDLLQEIHSLQEKFLTLFKAACYSTCFKCLMKAKNSWEGALDAIPVGDYQEAVTDLSDIFHETANYFTDRNKTLRLYNDPAYSLCKLYGIQTKLEDALSRRIWLKSGAYLVFDATEALTVFDVNSGKYEARKASEDTFYQINMDAAKEIALQIRLRNLSGIILIDFINLKDPVKEGELLKLMRSLVKADRIPTNVIDITPLGLMEITRKKVNKPLHELFGD